MADDKPDPFSFKGWDIKTFVKKHAVIIKGALSLIVGNLNATENFNPIVKILIMGGVYCVGSIVEYYVSA